MYLEQLGLGDPGEIWCLLSLTNTPFVITVERLAPEGKQWTIPSLHISIVLMSSPPLFLLPETICDCSSVPAPQVESPHQQQWPGSLLFFSVPWLTTTQHNFEIYFDNKIYISLQSCHHWNIFFLIYFTHLNHFYLCWLQVELYYFKLLQSNDDVLAVTFYLSRSSFINKLARECGFICAAHFILIQSR